MNHKSYRCNGTRHEIRSPRRKQRSVPVKYGDTIIKWIHFGPFRQRIAYELRRAYRKTLYTLKFAFLTSIPASIVVIILVAAIDRTAVRTFYDH